MSEGEKLLITEIWGLGDAILMTALLRSLPVGAYQPFVMVKPHVAELLRPSYPDIQTIPCGSGWSAFNSRYNIWKWDWPDILATYRRVRSERFALAVSGRRDPRDHLFMFASRIPIRCGISIRRSGVLLTHTADGGQEPRHRVEDWWVVGERIVDSGFSRRPPWLDRAAYTEEDAVAAVHPPRLVVHLGAGQPIKRWPESFMKEIVGRLRCDFGYNTIIIPDEDGYGSALRPIADAYLERLSIKGLASVLAGADLFIGNDSGPGHVAAALGTPVISIFGSALPVWFRPYGDQTCVVKLEPAPSPPRFDQGGEKERRCLTELEPNAVYPTIAEFAQRLRVEV